MRSAADRFSFFLNVRSPRDLPTGVRHREPVTVGVPLPRGVVTDPATLGVDEPAGVPCPVQVRSLDRWPDGSVRWALLDFQVDSGDSGPSPYIVHVGPRPPATPDRSVLVRQNGDGVELQARGVTLTIAKDGRFPISRATDGNEPLFDERESGLRLSLDHRSLEWAVSDVVVVEPGPLRAEVEVTGSVREPQSGIDLEAAARIEVFAGTPAVRISVTLRNPGAARHPDGQWCLGDAGSLVIDSAVLSLRGLPALTAVDCRLERGAARERFTPPFEIFQASSGGAHWNSRTHVDRNGQVRLPFRGYRVRSAVDERFGERALPIVVVRTAGPALAVTMPQFWQEFPRSLSVDATSVEMGLWPAEAGPHELQGGEQKTHRLVLAFGDDPVSDVPLAWCHDPVRVGPSPEYVASTGAVPYFLPGRDDPNSAYKALADVGLDPRQGFIAKREVQDEYGWRHFGDLPADHESAFQPPDRPHISHYNNQYDAIAGFALHFLRTADPRWWELMDDLARHVRDIDIYHTQEDKAAYNGGLFWHTAHYVDAGTSTHRTYPCSGTPGGGPSSEHNYNYGLMLHYFLTGERQSRDAAVGLGEWVIAMEDGGRTPFRWLSRGATGLATQTNGHQRPGRGAAHSILACLVAHQLTGDERFIETATLLLERCIGTFESSPMDYVSDIERYWSYTAFLQVVGVYVEYQIGRGEPSSTYAPAQACLVKFTRWMAEHERPYLDHRDRLEFPTETWVAQDLRKADVFLWAARHVSGSEREKFVERARFFFSYALSTLGTMPGHWYTRPLVLILVHGIRSGWLDAHQLPAPEATGDPASTLPEVRGGFVPQRARALRRAAVLTGALAAAAVAAAVWLLR